MRDLEGRRALVTGATGGLGRAIARALHARGATVIGSGRRADALEKLRGDLGGERVEAAVADLAESEALDELTAAAGRVDVLVANAALPASGRLDTYSEDELRRAIEVNLRAPLELARRLSPAMVERGEGHLVFVSSLSGKIGTAAGSIYAATKFGLRGFAMALRDELHGTGVGVTTVFPAFIGEAGMWAEGGQELPPGIALRSPDDVAKAVLRGIERNRGEVDVAPLPLRAMGWTASVNPAPVLALGRRMGSTEVAERLGESQRDKR